MKKVYSARRSLIRYFSLLLALALTLLLAFGVYSHWIYERQLRYCSDAALGLYRSSLLTETDRLAAFNQRISADSSGFRRLTAANLTQTERLSLQYHLKELINYAAPDAGLILLCGDEGLLQYTFGPKTLYQGMLTYRHQEAARALRTVCLELPGDQLNQWHVAECGAFTFLFNVYAYKNLRICSALDLDTIASDSASSSQENIRLFFDQNGRFLTENGLAEEKKLDAGSFEASRRMNDCILTRTSFPFLGIGLTCFMPVQGIWQYSRISMVVLGILAAVCIAVFLHSYRLMDHILIYPLQQVSFLSRQLSSVDAGAMPHLEEKDQVEELNTLRESLNSLAAQKVRLQKQSDDIESEKEHALLQYYQLQTRSHFFLNCLKSLYSMLETRDEARMKTMIIAFSNHLRFIFHDNLSLVPLRAEMDEVKDYHRIISMDSRQPLILTEEISPEAEKCLVPTLIVQTFLENSYKYNGRGREVLQFIVRIDRLEYEGKARLRIRLSDDGLGYPEETLKWLNGGEAPSAFDQYHIGINNLRRRMAILYGGDYELAFFNGLSGGANILISIPAREENEGEKP